MPRSVYARLNDGAQWADLTHAQQRRLRRDQHYSTAHSCLGKKIVEVAESDVQYTLAFARAKALHRVRDSMTGLRCHSLRSASLAAYRGGHISGQQLRDNRPINKAGNLARHSYLYNEVSVPAASGFPCPTAGGVITLDSDVPVDWEEHDVKVLPRDFSLQEFPPWTSDEIAIIETFLVGIILSNVVKHDACTQSDLAIPPDIPILVQHVPVATPPSAAELANLLLDASFVSGFAAPGQATIVDVTVSRAEEFDISTPRRMEILHEPLPPVPAFPVLNDSVRPEYEAPMQYDIRESLSDISANSLPDQESASTLQEEDEAEDMHYLDQADELALEFHFNSHANNKRKKFQHQKRHHIARDHDSHAASSASAL